ncbi:MAG TPA: glycosyltransferase family 9 protein [Gemmatirosa sp.]
MSSLANKYETFRTVAKTRGVPGVLRVFEWSYLPRIVPGYRWTRERALIAAAAPDVFAVRRAHPTPDLVLGYFGGIGDELLLTVVVHELRRRGFANNWVISEFPDVWRGNDDPALVVRWEHRHLPWLEHFGWQFVRPHYTRYLGRGDRDLSPRKHILTLMCEAVGIVGPVEHKPHLHLTDEERAAGALRPNQIAIQSAGLTARFSMKTKQWFPERFQAVVDALRPDFDLVQIGSPKDPPLDGALDLRGQTTLRETAAVLANSLTFVGQVGMPMHLARAVDCRSVIVYGGREHPGQTGYGCNENLYSPVPCSPCWKSNTCGHGMMCMRQITADDVVRAVERQVARHGQPLAVDTDVASVPPTAPARTTPDGRTIVTLTDIYGNRRELTAKPLRRPEPAVAPSIDGASAADYDRDGAESAAA